MFRFGIFFVFQTALLLICDRAEASANSTHSTALYSTGTVPATMTASTVASTGITPSSTFSATTTSAPPVTNSTTAQPTVTYPTATTAPPTTTTAPPTATTAQPPSGGEQEAVVLYISDMTEAKFEKRRVNFTVAVKKIVGNYCSSTPQKCDESSPNSYQVYIVPGYPMEDPYSPGELLVGFFISVGDGKFLSKNVLYAIVKQSENKETLNTALGYQITGVARLHLDFMKPTEFDGTSGKTKLLYFYFAAFCGAVLLAGLCVGVTCWYGLKKEKDDEVRPLTTSNMQLVDK